MLDSFEIETPLVWIRPYDKKKFTFILKPFMWNVDTVEAYKITNTKSTQSSYPCRICLVHKDNLTSNVLGKLRSPEDFQEKKDAFNPAISSQTYGYHFDNVSDYAIKLDLPKGIYLACVPDPLHVYLVGLVKHLHF